MPAATTAVMVLVSSTTSSSFVATLSSAVADPAAKVAVSGAVPDTIAPVSLTLTSTASSAAVAPVRVNVKAAAVPSVTGLEPGSMDMVGSPDAGPGTVADTTSERVRLSSVHTAPDSPQARTGSVMTMSPSESGSIVISQPALEPLSRRCAAVTVPPLTSNTLSRIFRWPMRNSSPKCTSNVNAVEPSWLSGTLSKPATSASLAATSIEAEPIAVPSWEAAASMVSAGS